MALSLIVSARQRGLVFLLVVSFVCSAVAAAAAEAVPAAGGQEKGLLDRSHGYISNTVEALGQKVDAFFGGDRIYQESTGSYMKVGGALTLLEGGETDFTHILRLKLVLPHTKDRLKLLIEADDEIVTSQKDSDRINETSGELGRGKSSTALRYILAQAENWGIDFDAGVKLRFPLDPFARLRGAWTHPLGEHWLFRLTEKVFIYNAVGFGESTRIEFDRPLWDDDLLRISSEATWHEEEDGNFQLSQNVLFYHQIDASKSMAYRAGVFAQTKPAVSATDYVVDVRYRTRVYKDWLFIDLTPGLGFRKVHDFDPEYSLRLGFEALFGDKYINKVAPKALR